MPLVRLIGNAALSFLTKLSSGYWSIFDPTNGFVASGLSHIAAVPMEKVASRYFFESDILFRIGLLRAKVLDIPMAATYGSAVSGLNPGKQLLPFLLCNLRNFFKRIVYNYFPPRLQCRLYLRSYSARPFSCSASSMEYRIGESLRASDRWDGHDRGASPADRHSPVG